MGTLSALPWETIWVAYRKPFPDSRGRVPELLRAFADRNEALDWANVEHNALSEEEGERWEYGVARLAGEAERKFNALQDAHS